MNRTIFLNKNIEVLIVSAGGVGTTFLMEEIGKYKTTNCSSNTDGYKHLPIPPISFNRNLKVVYVFGNPIWASISLFRRKYHHVQSINVQQYLEKGYTIPFEMSLDTYASEAKDGHYFERHLENWRIVYPIYPTLFIKYESLFDNLKIVADFLDLPSDFITNFPRKKVRQSELLNLSSSTANYLHHLYGKLAETLKNEPDTMIQREKNSPNYKKMMAKPYLRGMKFFFGKKMPLLRHIKNYLFK